jgi:2-oxoglutarate/2-oxoacid ferredoxin oxidoreductase subunit beta
VFNRIPLVHGEPIRCGPDGERGVARTAEGSLTLVAGDRDDLVVHDAHRDDPSLAFALALLAASPGDPTPIGVFRAVTRPVGIAEAGAKLADARANLVPGALAEVLRGGDTWTVA